MTYRSLRASLAVTFPMLLPVLAHSQQCSALLKDGVFDITNQTVDSSSATAFMSWFCEKQFGSESAVDSYSLEGAFPFKGLPVKLGFNANNESWSNWYSQTCSSSRYTFETKQRVVTHIATTSQPLVAAFNNCINSAGLHAWLERGGNDSSFVVATRYVPNGPKASISMHSFSTAGGIKCQPNFPVASAAAQRTLCERTDESGGTIVISSKDANVVEGGTIAVNKVAPIPQFVPPPPGPWRIFQVTASTTPDWRARITNWLAIVRPRQGSVYASISGGNDFYIWARQDGDGPISGFQVLSQTVSNNPNWYQQFSSTVATSKVIPIGFNQGSADIWYIQFP